ncbi:MAG TPA: class I SAM-dependent methyltransferase [Pyrinomonadaceae bacterium]|nr:class I SAM-dependent methyltransferase [Pyrinomonadaceae bacterium]
MACELHESGSFTDSDLERAPCPNGCNGGDLLLHEFERFQIYRCNDCSLVRLDPRLAESHLEELYERDYFSGHHATGYDTYELDQQHHELTAARRLSLIKQYKSHGKLLDIGCGFGYFLNVAAREGFEVYGLDVSTHAVEICRSRFDGRVRQGLLKPDAFPPAMFDVVTMFDLFEHVYHPAAFLSIINDITTPDAIVIITTPNHRSLLSRISGRNWVSYKLPEHVFYYTPETLRRIIKPHFEMETIQSAGQFCSLQFLAERLKTVNRPLGKMMLPLVKSLGVSDRVVYVNSGSMMVLLRKTQPGISPG